MEFDEHTAFVVNALASDDPDVRQGARHALKSQGNAAVSVIAHLLGHQDARVRHEASGILVEIGGRQVADSLARMLGDEREDVRVEAETGLIELGRESLIPLLRELIIHADSSEVRAGAGHVLHHLVRCHQAGEARPLLSLLARADTISELPSAAYDVLDIMLKGGGDGRTA